MVGFAPHQHVDQGGQVVNDLVGVRWDKSLSEVKRSQTRRAGSRMFAEGLERSSDGLRVNCWSEPNISNTQAVKTGVAACLGVLADHFIEDLIGVARCRPIQSLTGLGIGTFPTEVFTPLVAESRFNKRSVFFCLPATFVARQVLPKTGSFATEPPLEPLPRESNTLVFVLLASSRWGTQDTLN